MHPIFEALAGFIIVSMTGVIVMHVRVCKKHGMKIWYTPPK